MITPIIPYYSCLEDCTGDRKTPKYRESNSAMYYPPMEQIRGKDGFVSMFLKPNISKKPDAPEMCLQAKDSLNFTGLYNYFVDGRLSGYAYGAPLPTRTYSKDNKTNPFYDFRFDGYLFLMHYDDKSLLRPTTIELIVLAGDESDCLHSLLPSYCKMLQMGGFNDELAALRKQAGVYNKYKMYPNFGNNV